MGTILAQMNQIDQVISGQIQRAFRRWNSTPHKSQLAEWRKTPEGWAGNMVAWFGQKITEHMSAYEREFELTKDKPYGYKPKRTG